MKITIIGGGNMGGAIARGLASGSIFKESDISVIDVSNPPLERLKHDFPGIKTVTSNYDEIHLADIVVLAVKPWLIEDVILDIKFKLDYEKQILISIASGVTLENMEKSLNKSSDDFSLPALFRIIPNTAVSIGESMTLVATDNASDEQKYLVLKIFNDLGKSVLIDEEKISACTALTSCGIAFFFRYIRAAMLAGTEMGIYPKDSREMLAYTMKGAANLLLATGANPEDEIDKVTTPGGVTIKGLNELEANGFSNAVIKALKACK
ncbi:MAG: pyrroline-5-carboxylate reductase [Dysgonamonadaceae bacterium]|jgi:pyrroline-5-carboxylate reductase|nr:pyrroline-5-carboxylate reductase [Dysgonamonadaceae bacterium]